jgi:hypothetical protein
VVLSHTAPVLCEDHGEVAAGLKDTLPKRIGLDDLGGDLDSHTHETDGHG